jgi:hypothetical protein
MAISTPLPRSALRIDHTVLGYLGILGSPLLAFGFMASEAGQLTLGNGLMLSFLLGWMASMIALRGTGALGRSRFAHATSSVHLVTLSIAIVWQAAQTYRHDLGKGTLPFLIGDMCWPISVNMMTLVGIGTILAQGWKGWRRFTPFACGLCFPIGMVFQSIDPTWGMMFGVITAYTWCALGLAALLEARRYRRTEPNAA